MSTLLDAYGGKPGDLYAAAWYYVNNPNALKDYNNPDDRALVQHFTSARSLLGRDPTSDEFFVGLRASQTGQDINYYASLKQTDTAASETAAAKSATSSFLSGFAPYANLAEKNLTPAAAGELISLEQGAKSAQLALDTQKRAITEATATHDGAFSPALPVREQPAGSSSKALLIVAGVLLAAFFLLKRR